MGENRGSRDAGRGMLVRLEDAAADFDGQKWIWAVVKRTASAPQNGLIH